MVVERAGRYLAEQAAAGAQVELVALGARVDRIFRRRQQPLSWSGALSVTALPPCRLAFDLVRLWQVRYEERELDAVDLIYNAYHGTARCEPTVVLEQLAAVSLYGLLLESAAAEHSTRFQLLEGATQNAERLIAELTLAIQTARQQAVTREMQELAAGAGLIGPQRS
jgi:F0F1-type ATP synthase gamma subunit